MSEPPPPADRPPVPAAGRGGLWVLVGIGLFVGAVLWWALRPVPRPGPVAINWEQPVGERGSIDPYIGSKTCGECHPGEYALFTRSGHARTLRPAAERLVARELDGRTVTDPERPGVTWSYDLQGDQFWIERTENGESLRFLAELAFGSGHHATTFLTVTDPDPDQPRALEHRLTYFAADGCLGITPGHRAGLELPGVTPWGRELSVRDTLRCFRCHTTRLGAGRDGQLDFETMIPSVSCERCHGPARAHVEAARRGETDLTMRLGLDQWTADEMMLACGACHRHPSNAAPGVIRPDNPHLARFQPVGLLQSRCYTASNGALSCVTCHDPHARAGADPAPYVAACLDCHGGPAQTPCPVSPRENCLPCHMPGVDSGQNVLFTDHWIRVRTDADPQPSGSPHAP